MDENINLIKLLAMFPYDTNIIITDVCQVEDVFAGKIRELDANDNEKLNAINYQKYRIRALNVADNKLIIQGYYDNENEDS